MEEEDYRPMLKEELAGYFNIEKKDKKEFFKIIDGLEREGLIILDQDGYRRKDDPSIIVGRFDSTDKGYGFLIADDKSREDIFIPRENTLGAMNQDLVMAKITKKSENGRREEGEIIKILERKTKTLVGSYDKSKNFGFVIPDDKKIGQDIFVANGLDLGAKNKQKVVVEITKWPTGSKSPEGKIIEVLGYPGEKGIDILSVIRQFSLKEDFPESVKKEAKKFADSPSMEDIEGREDLRSLKSFTIDGPDAKDLDDAISIELLENTNYLLGVHIADVAHYVKSSSSIDEEAFERGNSVYLLDRVIPMLPRELSNGICSLNPGVDRLCLSVFMEIDKNGNTVSSRIVESVINSKKRLVYDDVSDFLEDKTLNLSQLYGIKDELILMEELAKNLMEKRDRRGSIDFDFSETKILLDKDGRPEDIFEEERRIANKIIEEFMLVCNETVSEQFFWSETPFLYRIHEEPSEEKIEEFNKIIHNFGYSLKGKQEIHPKELQNIVKEIKGKKEEPLISMLLLRSLRKARYSAEPDIHFGLSTRYYSHFTAPIRRYSDLVIHRIIKGFINGGLDNKTIRRLEKSLPDIADHVSMTERKAEEAERDVEDMKKAEYMVKYIGEEFNGVISSVTKFGIFVQLENTIEGLVHFNFMTDDYYIFDEENYYIIGERNKKIYRLGDQVKIEVMDANPRSRNIDFRLV